MGFYGYRGFGAFGFVGDAVIGNIGFAEQWSYDDWLNAGWGITDGRSNDYRPIGANVIAAAKANLQLLQDAVDSGSPTAQAVIDNYMTTVGNDSLPDWIDAVDQQTKRLTRWSSPPPPHVTYPRERIAAYTGLNNALTKLANLKVVDAQAELDALQSQKDAAAAKQASIDAAAQAAAAKTTADVAAAQAKKQGTIDAIAAAQAAIAAAAQAKAQAQAAAAAHQQAAALALQKHADTVAAVKTPLILAAVAVPVAVIAYMAFKKKSPAVAGYRRRRSRR